VCLARLTCNYTQLFDIDHLTDTDRKDFGMGMQRRRRNLHNHGRFLRGTIGNYNSNDTPTAVPSASDEQIGPHNIKRERSGCSSILKRRIENQRLDLKFAKRLVEIEPDQGSTRERDERNTRLEVREAMMKGGAQTECRPRRRQYQPEAKLRIV
jgi:hypothetical protein